MANTGIMGRMMQKPVVDITDFKPSASDYESEDDSDDNKEGAKPEEAKKEIEKEEIKVSIPPA